MSSDDFKIKGDLKKNVFKIRVNLGSLPLMLFHQKFLTLANIVINQLFLEHFFIFNF